jgi:integrase
MGKKKKTHLDQIVKQDIYEFHEALRARGCEDRTVANKHARLVSWLRFAGIDKATLPKKPKYEAALPTIYETEQITALLADAASNLRLCMLIAWKCGLREQELMHLEITDFNWSECTLRVQGKPKWGFKPKTWEQRDIPLTDDVVAKIKDWQKEHPGHTLLLPTRNRRPNTKLLLALKVRAKQAGLNCGVCESCKERKECKEYTLHRFRRTYITNLLRKGIDLSTVQAYAGHKDLNSTLRYLRPASGEEARAKLNAITW